MARDQLALAPLYEDLLREDGGSVYPGSDFRAVRDGLKVLMEYEGNSVLIEQGRHVAATFHPVFGMG